MISVRAIITYIIVLGMFPIVLEDFLEDFEVLLTVHLSVILVINQLNAQNIFIISLLYASTCFEHYIAHHQ